MPYSAPTPKADDGLMPTKNGYGFYTGLEMSKALRYDGEIVFFEQTDVMIIAHIVRPIQVVTPENPSFM